CAAHSALLSFPTRRSSDLGLAPFWKYEVSCLATASYRAIDDASARTGEGFQGDRPLSQKPKCTMSPGDTRRSFGFSRSRPVNRRSEEHTSELQSRENLVCR